MQPAGAFLLLTFLLVPANAASALEKSVDDKVLTVLISELGAENFEERAHAAKTLVQYGPLALRALRAATLSTDHEIARLAKQCIEKIEYNVKTASLLRQLPYAKSDEELVKIQSALVELGLAGLVPALVDLLDNSNAKVRGAAIYLLDNAATRSGFDLPSSSVELAVPKLLRLLQDKAQTKLHRQRVMELLEKVGIPGRRAVPILLSILETEGPEMASLAAQSLGHLGQHDARVPRALWKAFERNNIVVKSSALAAVGAFPQERAKIGPAILKTLTAYSFTTKQEMNERICLIRMLGAYGNHTDLSVQYLIQFYKDHQGDPVLRRVVMESLVKIGALAQKAIPGLKELGDDPDDLEFSRVMNRIKTIQK